MRVARIAAGGLLGGAVVVCHGLLTAGLATADDSTMTYGQMEKILEGQGVTVIQTTSIGDQLPKDQCTVIKQLTSANGHVMLSLDCRSQPKTAQPTGAGSQ